MAPKKLLHTLRVLANLAYIASIQNKKISENHLGRSVADSEYLCPLFSYYVHEIPMFYSWHQLLLMVT